jgi:hypothetical protein
MADKPKTATENASGHVERAEKAIKVFAQKGSRSQRSAVAPALAGGIGSGRKGGTWQGYRHH